MSLVYFVTPAWQRYELSRVVFEQRRMTIDFLAEQGVEARCVVVADDQNLDTAWGMGFDTLVKPNYALARRFNDGIQHAARKGADWIVPIGSDSFLDPAYLFPLPEPKILRTSSCYAVAEAGRIGRVPVHKGAGVGPYMIHRGNLPRTGRPAQEWRKKGVDGSTIRGLRGRYRLEWTDLHPWQYVGFRSFPQLNSYDKLYGRLGVGEENDVAGVLSEHYPAQLVGRAIAACAASAEVAA